jgi:ATP-dependent exoDNAse (exonuclease V) beta subunit
MTGAAADRAARERALDVRRSFIVQAPAGSGKTELLIQRYLTLLLTVQHPEQIVAITFTRKAAAEMRERVLLALRSVAGAASRSDSARAETLGLARLVLARDTQLEWALLRQPQRMRIDTLDAVNVWLAQQLPILAGGIAESQLTEEPMRFYQAAAQRTLARLADEDPLATAVASLLALVENSLERLGGLVAALLPSRDRWLRQIVTIDEGTLRAQLEAGLIDLCADRLHAVETLIGDARLERLIALARHAARHATHAPTRQLLAAWNDADGATVPAGAATVGAWQGIARLLLTKDGQWRKRFSGREGFGSEHAAQSAALAQLCAQLQSSDEIRDALVALGELPETRYSAAQWSSLAALRVVLLHAVAELRVLFAEQQTVDFVELAMAAEHALGGLAAPSELLLAIDRRVQHILVDEFQDTSHAQWRILELLTAGWTPDDGRSLFLVGDPMQSIYRFRDADMTLFLRAQREGIGDVKLEPLVLESNFRSGPAVVAWVNRAFGRIFPDRDRVELGVARFRGCVPVRAAAAGQSVELHALRSDDAADEIERVADIVARERQASHDQSIAILVQSRAHLLGLGAQLHARGVDAHALEIESLAETGVGQDLLGLTRALAHRGDRIAWLALLHAPWCGLGWRDLEALCGDAADRAVWDLLCDEERVTRLSRDGQARARAVRRVLDQTAELRARMSFGQWVEHTWRMLDGPGTLTNPADHDGVREFFIGLGRLARGGDLEDPAGLESFFSEPTRQADPPRGPGVEMMTIHRAKGLEFDTVIVLGLGRRVGRAPATALYWQQRLRADGATSLLVAPLTAEETRLERYLRQAEQQRDRAERARLLYVATTRARERLHLVARLGAGQESPQQGTLLAVLWPEMQPCFRGVAAVPVRSHVPRVPVELPLIRLAREFPVTAVAPAAPSLVPPRAAARPQFDWAGYAAIQVGTLVHRYLQSIADTGVATWDVERVDAELADVRAELALLGVAPRDLESAAEQVRAALQRTLADARGRWILGSHEEAAAELRLTVVANNRLEHLQLDRTFIDAAGTRWIIDYKTSRHEGGDPAAFMDSEVARYCAQLERYAAALASIDARPIRLGLYFPLLTGFREWDFIPG